MEFKLLSGRAGVKRTLSLKAIRVLFGHVSQSHHFRDVSTEKRRCGKHRFTGSR